MRDYHEEDDYKMDEYEMDEYEMDECEMGNCPVGDYEISLAPMIDVTTSHFRKFVRLSSKRAVLFTEMIVSNTVNHITVEKLKERLGEYDKKTVVQIGGSDPEDIKNAVKKISQLGFKRFNLNCGCPSSRVLKGCFGAILMFKKELVAEIINQAGEEIEEFSLKIRTGVDSEDSFEFLDGFISHIVENTNTRTFYIHARKCWLKGLSPKQNRNIPELNYEYVYKIKRKYPFLKIILNGGMKGREDLEIIRGLDGMMIGREAISNIFVFKEMEEGKGSNKEIISEYLNSYDKEMSVNMGILSPMINLLKGRKRCKEYKRKINELLRNRTKMKDVFKEIELFIDIINVGEDSFCHDKPISALFI